MEAFLAKKRAGVPATTSQQTASETVSEESPTTLSYADALATGAGTIASTQDEIIQCPSKTCGSLLVPQSSGNVQIYDAESLHRGVERSASPTTVRSCDVPALSVTDSNLHLVLELPANLTSITKHYVDFIRCDDSEVANSIKDAMQHQWSSLIMPGQKLKVRMKDKLVSAVVEKCYYISKLSFDCLYYYATAKADVRLLDTDVLREFQFRELVL